MKVLQIVAAPTGKKGRAIGINGPERRTANLVRKWAAYEIEPVICYPSRGRLWEIFKSAQVPLVDFEIGSKFNFIAPIEISSIARSHRVNLIHTQGPGSLDLFACIAGRLSNLPVLITRPSMTTHNINYSLVRREIYRFIDKITFLLAKRIVAVSNFGLDHMKNILRIDPHKLRSIYNGVAISDYNSNPCNMSSGRKEEPPVVLGMMAQLTHGKGWNDFITVIQRLLKEDFNIRGVVIGDGPLRNYLQKEVINRGIFGYIQFMGFQEKVARFLAQMDIFLFTSHREGLSMAIIEAMASGLPIVATDVGGIREQVVDQCNGFIVPVDDINSIVIRCRKLIVDPQLRSSQGKASRIKAEEMFNEDRMLKQYVECYKEVIRK